MQAPRLSAEEFKSVKKRVEQAWSARSPWNAIYQEAYDFVVPQRRPKANGQLRSTTNLYDMTAVNAAMKFAGRLQQDLFPPGQDKFVIEAGPLAMQALMATGGKDAVKVVNRELDKTAKVMQPFFLTGDWDTSIHEACLELAVGTSAVLPVSGDPRHDPLNFATIPFDQIAIWIDMLGKVVGVDWKQEVECSQVFEKWPNAAWPEDFRDRVKNKPDEPVVLHQTWYRDPLPGGGWHFIAWVDKFEAEAVHERYRTQPISVPRYYRVPGEAYGRGVVLTALPSIRTLNKAQELALKSAAIQMLGIWAYRAGGTFNPNAVRMGPGEFWAMQSTGGILGPDVQRLDAASGNINVAQLVIGNLQDQVKQSMFDNTLPEYSGTPRSAAEVLGRMQQNADVHIGAFGRLVSEIMPVLVPRCAEILHDHRILSTVQNIDNLLFAVRVRSPMAAALNAQRLGAIANYFEIGAAIVGPENMPLYGDRDVAMDLFAEGLMVDKELVPDPDRKRQITEEIQAAQMQQLQMLLAQEAAKNGTKAVADIATQQATQQRQAA